MNQSTNTLDHFLSLFKKNPLDSEFLKLQNEAREAVQLGGTTGDTLIDYLVCSTGLDSKLMARYEDIQKKLSIGNLVLLLEVFDKTRQSPYKISIYAAIIKVPAFSYFFYGSSNKIGAECGLQTSHSVVTEWMPCDQEVNSLQPGALLPTLSSQFVSKLKSTHYFNGSLCPMKRKQMCTTTLLIGTKEIDDWKKKIIDRRFAEKIEACLKEVEKGSNSQIVKK